MQKQTVPKMGDQFGAENCCFGPFVPNSFVSVEKKVKVKEYPPTIPCLVRAEKNMGSHKPWVLQRYYTGDGRLIIKEEKAQAQEYFKAHRSNGRLTLQLVPLNDDIFDGDDEEEEVEREGNVGTTKDEGDEDETAVIGGGGGGGSGGKCCYELNSMGSGSGVFGLSVSPSRAVHIRI